MRSVPDHHVRAGINHPVRKADHVATGFSVIKFFNVAHMHGGFTFCATVKRHQHQVMILCQLAYQAGSGILVMYGV